MSDQFRGVTIGWPVAALVAVGLVAAGAGASLLLRTPVDEQRPERVAAPGLTMVPAPGSAGRNTVTLTQELMTRAGIETAVVETASLEVGLRLPAEVQADAYRSVAITPLVAGRVTVISAELGDRVRPGQTLARIYSPELARAQTAFLASEANLAAHDQRLRRTERLVEIGASSQQELEQVHAEHTSMTTRVAADRADLELLGFSAERIAGLGATGISALVDVPAPIAGVITERGANVGLNVDPSTPLFTVVDLSSVWVVADLYERDFALVRTGSAARVTASAYPDLRFDGRVAYVDPQMRSDTRTAKARVETPNADGRLRLGMYVDVELLLPGQPAVVIPLAAVQAIGDRSVVYVPAGATGTFEEREVRLGRRAGEIVEVQSGLSSGDHVVTRGAFFLRAEKERGL